MTLGEQLYLNANDETEGDLSKKLSTMENNKWFCVLCKRIGLDRHLRIGKMKITPKARDKMCSDILEAYIGAVYLDQLNLHGKGRAYEVASTIFLGWQNTFGESLEEKYPNPIGTLQEQHQKRGNEIPTYNVERLSGKDNNPIFQCTCTTVWGITQATGTNKKIARENSARVACDRFLQIRSTLF